MISLMMRLRANQRDAWGMIAGKQMIVEMPGHRGEIAAQDDSAVCFGPDQNLGILGSPAREIERTPYSFSVADG